MKYLMPTSDSTCKTASVASPATVSDRLSGVCVAASRFGSNVKAILCIVLTVLLFSSCFKADEVGITQDYAYLEISGIETREHPGTDEGDPADCVVSSLRIMAFDKTPEREIQYNDFFDPIGNNLLYKMATGEYDFVFIANEPSVSKSALNVIRSYSDLNLLAFPAGAFAANINIPMLQIVENVELLIGTSGIKVGEGAVQSALHLSLDRLGVRLDVDLRAYEDMDSEFTGITLTNIPDKVGLMPDYSGTITRNTQHTISEGDFVTETSTETDILWQRTHARIILPANEFAAFTTEDNATELTVNLTNLYSPSCKLKIDDGNYTLPRNTKLDLIATLKRPLEVNIKASDWGAVDSDVSLEQRVLNVTQSDVSITDFNGTRIMFYSNMPVVKVKRVYEVSNGNAPVDVNAAFNSIAGSGATRFKYDPNTGAGYMDVLVDKLYMENRNQTNPTADTQTYDFRIVLSAEESDGTHALEKEIRVKVTQRGERFPFTRNADGKTPTGYCGVFYRANEKGERIITGESNNWWVASTDDDFIILSTTPSFDPNVGTDNPGDPELYPVLPNPMVVGPNGTTSREGQRVEGTGRIYFRVGLTETINPGEHRYGTIKLEYFDTQKSNTHQIVYIYVRQGETPDYIYGGSDSSRPSARKFSAFNITHPTFKNNTYAPAPYYAQIPVKGGVEVKYPSQIGALLQWGIHTDPANLQDMTGYEEFRRRAVIPTDYVDQYEVVSGYSGFNGTGFQGATVFRPYNETNPSTNKGGDFSKPLRFYWNPSSGTKYKDYFEMCPPGYHRPSDGPTDAIAFNKTDADVQKSEWRMSLLKDPRPGNGNQADTLRSWNFMLGGEEENKNITAGFYADGFFDRRPIRKVFYWYDIHWPLEREYYLSVAFNTTGAATGGTLVRNHTTNATLFLPSGGRRRTGTSYAWDSSDAKLEYSSETGYYLSSSVANDNVDQNTWVFEFAETRTAPVTTSFGYAGSLRCVVDQ